MCKATTHREGVSTQCQLKEGDKPLLGVPLICEVIEEGGKKGYRVTGQGSYLHLVPEIFASPFVVSPTGFSRKWHSLYGSESKALLVT